jgi:hypothetical protein
MYLSHHPLNEIETDNVERNSLEKGDDQDFRGDALPFFNEKGMTIRRDCFPVNFGVRSLSVCNNMD